MASCAYFCRMNLHPMRNFLFLVVLMLLGCASQAQVLFTFGSDTVTKQEFERVYLKNNRDSIIDPKSVDEYLDLYINFKLRVKEAKALGLDTLESFVKELEGYKKQLAQPYLVDKKVTEALVKEAYDRSLWEVNASHILIACDENALPKDTLEAWNKIMDMYKKIQKGASFDSLAVLYSEDPSAKKNKGNLGYFSVFGVLYSFECAAYNTPVGTVSKPVRTRFGYHLVKVNDKRAARGEIKVSHIMLKLGTDSASDKLVKTRIDSIYAKLRNGASWDDMVKLYSEDESSSQNGGQLNWFNSTAALPVEFKDAAFGILNLGDISMPVRTAFGWHIIRKIDWKKPPLFDEIKDNLKQRVNKDQRSEVNKQAVIDRVKKENGFKDLGAISAFYSLADSTLLQGKWTPDTTKITSKGLFVLGGKTYSQKDFANYVRDYQVPRMKTSLEAAINGMYKDFVNTSVLDFEESHLAEKQPDFKNLLTEYHDGILLFDLMDKKVWSKGIFDTVGLKTYFEANQTKYMWKERANTRIFSCADEKTAKKLEKMLSKGKTTEEILTKLNKDNPLNVAVKEGKYERGENHLVDSLGFTAGLWVIPAGNMRQIVKVERIMPSEPKSLNDVKGIVTSDYQGYLEKEWIKELRAKYPVVVNAETRKSLFQK